MTPIKAKKLKKTKLFLFATSVPAGFPSPAHDFIEKKLDLNDYLIRHPAATFFVRVKGTSMINAGIYDGDILVVDRSLETCDGDIVLAVIDSEFTVKRVQKKEGRLFLLPENPQYNPIEIKQEDDFLVWGVVTNVIHELRR